MRMQRITSYCLLLLLLPSLAQSKIVFKSKRTVPSSLYVMDDDGRNVQRITTYSAWWPVWSPDGKQIAFSKKLPTPPKQTPKYGIFIIKSDGSNEHRLTDDEGDLLGDTGEGEASWSPDGYHIAFSSYRGGRASQIWTMNLRTRAMRQLTRTDGLTTFPSWSPDGKYIAYRDDSLNGQFTIYVMRADGSGQSELAPGDFFRRRGFPRWSPDSQSVVCYEDTFDQNFRIVSRKAVIYKLKGGVPQVVGTPDNWVIHSACFMDDGKQMLISAKDKGDKNATYDLYRFHLGAGKFVNLTNTPGDDFIMDWISDDVLSVTPQSKKKVTWGKLKQPNSERGE